VGSQIIEVKEDTTFTSGATVHTVMVGDQTIQAARQKGTIIEQTSIYKNLCNTKKTCYKNKHGWKFRIFKILNI